MDTIKIKNIGPIKNVDITLNKVNIIMGPQSSGKSTIAKIISYCQWVEKRFILDGEFKDNFIERFMDFHRISEVYFDENSIIEYKSDSISILYKGLSKKPVIKLIKKGESYKNSKNIYIPAERNFVSVIPNLGRYKERNDNIMNFLYDWYEIKKKTTKKNALPILNLDAYYYHIEDSDSDFLFLKDKNNLLLSNASSGLQSIVPLIVIVDFLTKNIFKEERAISSNEMDEQKKIIKKQIILTLKLLDLYEENSNEGEIIGKDLKNLKNKLKNRNQYHFSQFIIEEPEQNLFPRTQRDLVYHLINKVNDKKRNHKLVLTTHSPYILYALNNCMMGFSVKDKMPKKEQKNLISNQSWIDPKLVSMWEIEEGKGTLKSIKDNKTNTVNEHYFNKIMSEVMDEYYAMLNYL